MHMHTLICFFTLIVVFSSVFSRLDSVGQLLSAHEIHNQQSVLITKFCSTNDSIGWLPVDHHLLVLLQRSSSNNSKQHVLLQHPVLLQDTLLKHPLSSKDNATVQAVIFWRRLSTLQQQQQYTSPVRHRHT